MWRRLSFILVSISILSSCAYKEELRSFSDFDSQLWPYLEAFEMEAGVRGISIDIDELEVRGDIQVIEDNGVAGWCRFSPSQPNLIAIDKEFWEEANSTWREFVVFHELGHCILARGHRETQDANGNCLSIMQSGTGTCRVVYSDQTRSAYLDELFNPLNF